VFDVDVKNEYQQVIVKTAASQNPNIIAEDVRQQLRKDHNKKVGEEDFTLQTTEQLMDSFNSVLLIVQVVIIGIAAISLLIGGIGIMNTMYTAVVERTQEIGIMKAIGARNSDILTIFMMEAGVLGLVGGAIGVAIGLGIAKAVEFFGAVYLGSPLLRAWWSWELIAAALLFAFVVGMLSGTLPAYQASKQKPVDSLRYE
jgi:putative ABC transport system permease protein